MREGEGKLNKDIPSESGGFEITADRKITTKVEDKKCIESPINLREITQVVVLDMMAEAKNEFAEDIQQFIEKRKNGVPLFSKEQSKFDKARNEWFMDRFGIPFEKRLMTEEEKAGIRAADQTKEKLSFDLMAKSILIVDPDIKTLLDKLNSSQELSDAEKGSLRDARNGWWGETFRSSYKLWNGEITPRMANFLRRQGIDVGGYGEISAGAVSKKELLDLKMNTRQHGWLKYWASKLRPELDIIPEAISQLVLEASGKDKLLSEKQAKLAAYVEKRILVLKFSVEKRQRMAFLHDQLSAIDAGEDFYSKKEKHGRRLIFFDDQANKFYVEEARGKKYLALGDIVADHTWGIKYRADISIPPRVKRMLEKRIVINEARRAIEDIYDDELGQIYGIASGVGSITENKLESKVKKWESDKGFVGIIAERAIREFLNRASFNNPGLNFFVERSNAFEDTELKYDFKIRKRLNTRGVAIEGIDMPREEYKEEKQKIGLQLTISSAVKPLSYKAKQIRQAKTQLEFSGTKRFVRRKVNDIVLVALDLPQFGSYFRRWLEEGKPSGGPEQYMSIEEKKRVLLEATKNFIQITDEELEKIFPPEPAEDLEKKAV